MKKIISNYHIVCLFCVRFAIGLSMGYLFCYSYD